MRGGFRPLLQGRGLCSTPPFPARHRRRPVPGEHCACSEQPHARVFGLCPPSRDAEPGSWNPESPGCHGEAPRGAGGERRRRAPGRAGAAAPGGPAGPGQPPGWWLLWWPCAQSWGLPARAAGRLWKEGGGVNERCGRGGTDGDHVYGWGVDSARGGCQSAPQHGVRRHGVYTQC